MSNDTGTVGQNAIAKARQELLEEKINKAVKVLKEKYRELDAAETVVSNLKRDIKDLEEEINQGNI